MSQFPEDLSNFQRFPIVYPASAQFKNGSQESAQPGAVAKLQFSLNNNPHEITGLRIMNQYELPAAWYQGNPLYWGRLDVEQTVSMRMAQQNIVIDQVLQALLCGGNGSGSGSIHWHPFELPYPTRGGNNVTVDITRVTGYTLPGSDPADTIDAVTVYAALVGWMYVGPGGVMPGPPSTGFNAHG